MSTRKKHKRTRSLIAVLLIGLLVCGCLAGCGSESAEQSASSQISASEDSGQKVAKDDAAKEKSEAKKAKKEKKEEKKAEESGKTEEEEASSEEADSSSSGQSSAAEKKSSESSAKKNGGKKNKKKASGKSSKESGSSSGSSGSSESSGQQSHQEKCQISITCHNLVGNGDLDSNLRSRVPSSGVIMAKTSVNIQSGDSVYDVLKRAAHEKGIVVSAENTSLGIYVAGIAGFYEKDAGAQSGWKYKVNGTYPNDSAGDVKVHDGDVIEWVYALHP